MIDSVITICVGSVILVPVVLIVMAARWWLYFQSRKSEGERAAIREFDGKWSRKESEDLAMGDVAAAMAREETA